MNSKGPVLSENLYSLIRIVFFFFFVFFLFLLVDSTISKGPVS